MLIPLHHSSFSLSHQVQSNAIYIKFSSSFYYNLDFFLFKFFLIFFLLLKMKNQARLTAKKVMSHPKEPNRCLLKRRKNLQRIIN
jgi:hypothetical protein